MENKRHRMSTTAKDNLVGYGLIAPSLILLVIIGMIPIIITVSYSFQYRVLTDPLNIHFIGLQNYVTLFKDGNFQQAFKNTMIFAVLSIIFQLFFGFVGAFLMHKATKGVGLVRTAVLIPWAIPGIIIAYMFSFMFNDQLGVVNRLLQTTGIIGSSITWLTSKYWAMLVVVLADTWKQFPYVALMLLAGLQTISDEQYEAAKVDGAGKLRCFFSITLPNLKSVLLIILLFRTMGSIRIFDIIFGITGGGPANSTSTLLYQAYKYLFGDMNFGLGSALSTIITLLILMFSIIYIKVLKTDD